jgi:Mg2+ and Co2+ transporter CorA
VDQLHLRLIHDQLERLRDIALRSGTHDQLAAIKRLQRTLWAYV